MAKTGAKSNKKAPIEHVNAGKRGGAWWNDYSRKNATRAARKEPRMAVPVPPGKVGAR